MKKSPRKLMLRSETIRTLANMDLSRAVGGVAGTDDKSGCVIVAAPVVVVTTACG
jgi:hypothetical protein